MIGLQSRMLVESAWSDRSLEAMAADYANEIRQVQPHGPYSLVGWSLGGLLVTLVAAELERWVSGRMPRHGGQLRAAAAHGASNRQEVTRSLDR